MAKVSSEQHPVIQNSTD